MKTAASSKFPSSAQPTPLWAKPNNVTNGAVEEEFHDSTFEDHDMLLLQPYSTLDEPVRETIMRDVSAVASKLKVVLLPLDKTSPLGYASVSTEEALQGENQRQVLSKLREWDLWGPLFLCLFLSVLLSIRAPKDQASAVFASVFVAMWAGSAIVTINAQLLGSHISFFQSVCVLGYCVFPLVISATVIGILNPTPLGVIWLDMIWVLVGFVWSTRASTVFIGQYIALERRALAVFPVYFFYTFLGWLVLLF